MRRIRLPLGDLEEARRNPSAYRAKMEAAEATPRTYGFFNALRDALFFYHAHAGSRSAAHECLKEKCARFTNQRKFNQVADQLDWYVDGHEQRAWEVVRVRANVTVPLPSWVPTGMVCTGQLATVEAKPEGGFAAWLWRKEASEEGTVELRVPLIQIATAEFLHVPPDEITVGIHAFREQRSELHSFSASELQQAQRDLDALIARMGFER